MSDLPPGWELVRFGEIVESAQYGLSCAASAEGTIPILGMANVHDGVIDTRHTSLAAISGEEYAKYRIRKGDLLFNRTNSAALVGKSAVALSDIDAVFASYLVRFTINRKRALPEYVGQYFSAKSSAAGLTALSTPGVSQYNINPTTLRQHFWIVIPPIHEQQMILAVLNRWDTLMNRMVELVSAKRRLMQGLEQQLLTGRLRFSKFISPRGSSAPSFTVGRGFWDFSQIAQIAVECNERNNRREPLPVLSCTKHEGLVHSLAYFGKRMFSSNTSNYKVVRRGQFVYATNHLEEGSIGLLDGMDAGLISPMYTVFEPNPKQVEVSFLYRLFKTEAYRRIFQANTSASVNRRGSLRWKQFAKIRVPLPSLAEQRHIADTFDTLALEIDLLTRQADALARQKQGLMAKLLTGQIRARA